MTQQITTKSPLFLVAFIMTLMITTSATEEGGATLLAAPSLLSIFNTVTSSMPVISVQFVAQVCQPNQIQNSQNICIKPQYIEGCQTYYTSTTCNKCSVGYTLTKLKKCDFSPLYTGIVTHILGCIKQSSADVCDTCASGFYKTNNKCKFGIKNCAVYNQAGQCTQCTADYSLMLSQCRHNSILGCKFQTDDHTCTECYEPFKLFNHKCDIEQCRILNDYGCVACQCGYYLTAQRSCQPISPGCLRYQRGLCKDCLPHYKLKGGICEIQGCLLYQGNYCRTCSDKYQNVQGECHFKNCLDWLNDSCLSCKKGYALSKGVCISTNSISCQ